MTIKEKKFLSDISVGFRNRLIHAYDSLDDTLVWAIINRHLQPLKAEVGALIIQGL